MLAPLVSQVGYSVLSGVCSVDLELFSLFDYFLAFNLRFVDLLTFHSHRPLPSLYPLIFPSFLPAISLSDLYPRQNNHNLLTKHYNIFQERQSD